MLHVCKASIDSRKVRNVIKTKTSNVFNNVGRKSITNGRGGKYRVDDDDEKSQNSLDNGDKHYNITIERDENDKNADQEDGRQMFFNSSLNGKNTYHGLNTKKLYDEYQNRINYNRYHPPVRSLACTLYFEVYIDIWLKFQIL